MSRILFKGGGGEEARGTSNYRNPVRKFAIFPLTESIKWKTPSPVKNADLM